MLKSDNLSDLDSAVALMSKSGKLPDLLAAALPFS